MQPQQHPAVRPEVPVTMPIEARFASISTSTGERASTATAAQPSPRLGEDTADIVREIGEMD
jgi:hypothetical protein